MFKTYIPFLRILFALIIFIIVSCATQPSSNKITIAIELHNGKDIKLSVPLILSHQMKLEYSDYSGSNYIAVYNKYVFISKKDTVDMDIKTYPIEVTEIDCNKRKDSLTINWAQRKIRDENRFANSFSSEIIYRNNSKIICTYYNSGANIDGCINNATFRIDIRNCKDEKLIKEIIKSLTIE